LGILTNTLLREIEKYREIKRDHKRKRNITKDIQAREKNM